MNLFKNKYSNHYIILYMLYKNMNYVFYSIYMRIIIYGGKLI